MCCGQQTCDEIRVYGRSTLSRLSVVLHFRTVALPGCCTAQLTAQPHQKGQVRLSIELRSTNCLINILPSCTYEIAQAGFSTKPAHCCLAYKPSPTAVFAMSNRTMVIIMACVGQTHMICVTYHITPCCFTTVVTAYTATLHFHKSIKCCPLCLSQMCRSNRYQNSLRMRRLQTNHPPTLKYMLILYGTLSSCGAHVVAPAPAVRRQVNGTCICLRQSNCREEVVHQPAHG
jgi:hypothetical protein